MLAWQDDAGSAYLAMLILSGAVLAQAGINLINDLEDLQLNQTVVFARKSRQLIQRNALIGLLCFLVASGIAAYLVMLRGWSLFFIILCSGVLALNYNFGPINFKHRGLAVVQVFVLMGLALVQGAYVAMTGEFSLQVAIMSLPISFLVSLLLLSNELRDWEIDRDNGVRTLSVRIGYSNAEKLYWILIVLAYVIALIFYILGDVRQAWWLLLPMPMLIPISRYLKASCRPELTPMTGRFFFAFGAAFILSL